MDLFFLLTGTGSTTSSVVVKNLPAQVCHLGVLGHCTELC